MSSAISSPLPARSRSLRRGSDRAAVRGGAVRGGFLATGCEFVQVPAPAAAADLVATFPGEENGPGEEDMLGLADYPEGDLVWRFCYPITEHELAGALVLYIAGKSARGAWRSEQVQALQRRLAGRGIASASIAAGNLDPEQRGEFIAAVFSTVVLSAAGKAADPAHPLQMDVLGGRFGLVGHSAGGQGVVLERI